MRIELKALYSGDINKPQLPDDPTRCMTAMYADIGIQGEDGSDTFGFVVVTPLWLVAHPETQWARGYLLLNEFSWAEIERMVGRLVSSVSATKWEEAAKSLGRFMDWEFENYQPYRA